MKLQEKIKSWCKDEKFMSFAQERARKEVCEVAENHRIDPQYEELDEAFEYDDRYIAPLVTYLTYKLRLALLQRNAGKRKRGIWWVLVHVEMQGYYVEIFSAEFENLLTELRDAVFFQRRLETYELFFFRTVVQNTNSSSIHEINDTITFSSDLCTRVSDQLAFDTCTNNRRLTSQKRNCLTHHV